MIKGILLKLTLATIVPRLIHNGMNNLPKLKNIIPQKKTKLDIFFNNIKDTHTIEIDGDFYKLDGFINEEDEKYIYVTSLDDFNGEEHIFDLHDTTDRKILEKATLYKLTKI